MTESHRMPASARRALEALLPLALNEDLGASDDVTSLATIPADRSGRAEIVAKGEAVVCGIEAAGRVLAFFDPDTSLRALAREGQPVAAGDCLGMALGRLRSLLAGERTALNVLQRLSGIATLTRRYVEATAGTRARIVDTRKTLPGWRALDKWAVRMGGGANHRSGLGDGILIKDNHIAACGSVEGAIEAARAGGHHLLRVEVEVTNPEELAAALSCRPDAILLDNMDLAGLRASVEAVRARVGDAIVLEASGNVTLERVHDIAMTGVDLISVGALTHSVAAADLSMNVHSGRSAPEG